MEPVEKLSTVSFGADAEIGEKTTVILRYPNDHESYLGTTLLGRGTSVIGRRRGPPPEEDRASEAEILKKEKEYGEKVDSIGNRIPEMVCHPDPNFLCSSTKTVRKCLPTDGSRRALIIIFRCLQPVGSQKRMICSLHTCGVSSVSATRRPP